MGAWGLGRPTAGSGGPTRVPSKKSAAWLWATLLMLPACEPELTIGAWECAGSAQGGAPNGSPPTTPEGPVTVPWSSGFEDGFCGFGTDGGFCYANPAASYELVRQPVHSGTYAAAFHVVGQAEDGLQARCARQGSLPAQAYYGAWFYVPDPVTASDNWNLFHFDGETADIEHGLWDVSLLASPTADPSLYVFDFLRMTTHTPVGPPRVPVGQWFHLEVFLRRATDATGAFELYLDGELVFSLAGVATDDSELGQWYVGSLAATITPSPNTLYVDDVTIATERQGAP